MSEESRIARQLRRSFALLAFGLLAVVCAGVPLLRASARVLAPEHGGGLAFERGPRPTVDRPTPIVLGETDAEGLTFEVVVRDETTFLRERGCLRRGWAPEGCELRIAERALGPGELLATRLAPGRYELTIAGAPKPLRFEVWRELSRRLRPENLASPRVVPGLLGLVAVLALVVGLARARLGFAYARRMHAWREVTLTAGGMLEDEGTTLGVVDGTRRLRPGAVLVAPASLPRSATYRDLPVVAPGAIAQGSHAVWVAGTELRLRDARVLSLLASGAVFASAIASALTR